MAEIRSQDKRDKLRLIWQTVQTAGQSAPGASPSDSPPLTLQTALLNALSVCDAALNGPTPGTFLASSSEAGGASSFQMLHDFSPIVAKRLIGELCDCYDKAVERITRFTGAAPANDQAIFAEMMHLLRSIRKFRTDFTGTRYGIGYRRYI